MDMVRLGADSSRLWEEHKALAHLFTGFDLIVRKILSMPDMSEWTELLLMKMLT